MYANLNKKCDSFRGNKDLLALKRRGRPRKYITSGKPIGRPRKFRPPIGDPIKFLQAASLSGLFKVNDENTQISGLSSFINPNFRNSDKVPEMKVELAEPSVQQQQHHHPQPLPISSTDSTTDSSKMEQSEVKNCFACQFCGKSYKKKKHYNRHVNFECINTEPRFLCTMCSYKARRKEHLIRHLRSHIGDMMNSSDYGLLSVFKDDTPSDLANVQAHQTTPESPDMTASSPTLPVNNHNGQVYNAPFGFVAL